MRRALLWLRWRILRTRRAHLAYLDTKFTLSPEESNVFWIDYDEKMRKKMRKP